MKIFTKGKVFIDTNVLVYLFSTELEKRQHCSLLLSMIKKDHTLVWSTQIVQEFYNVMTAKFNKDPQAVKATLKFFDDFELVINNLSTIENAIDTQTTSRLSFWDSLVISAAQLSKCTTVLTEDLNHGQAIRGIQLQSPFEVKL